MAHQRYPALMGDPAHPRTERGWRSNSVGFDLSMVAGFEPVEGTWFEASDEPPLDLPLIMLIPIPRLATES